MTHHNQLIAIVVGQAIALALGGLLFMRGDHFVGHRAGKLLLWLGLLVIPVTVSLAGTSVGIERSSNTQFCLSCHEMEDYGRSLFVDNSAALAAVHYQNRSIPRESTCYACHTDYAMFGDVKAKLNGLMHVWVHYTKQVPEKITLYQPYPDHNCLHCHADARNYLEVDAHRENDAVSGAQKKKSCLSCHQLAHDLKGAAQGNFWQEEGP